MLPTNNEKQRESQRAKMWLIELKCAASEIRGGHRVHAVGEPVDVHEGNLL